MLVPIVQGQVVQEYKQGGIKRKCLVSLCQFIKLLLPYFFRVRTCKFVAVALPLTRARREMRMQDSKQHNLHKKKPKRLTRPKKPKTAYNFYQLSVREKVCNEVVNRHEPAPRADLPAPAFISCSLAPSRTGVERGGGQV